MENKKKAICLGNWGIPAYSDMYVPIGSGINKLIKDELYWIPINYNCNQENSLFKEFKEIKSENKKEFKKEIKNG